MKIMEKIGLPMKKKRQGVVVRAER